MELGFRDTVFRLPSVPDGILKSCSSRCRTAPLPVKEICRPSAILPSAAWVITLLILIIS